MKGPVLIFKLYWDKLTKTRNRETAQQKESRIGNCFSDPSMEIDGQAEGGRFSMEIESLSNFQFKVPWQLMSRQSTPRCSGRCHSAYSSLMMIK